MIRIRHNLRLVVLTVLLALAGGTVVGMVGCTVEFEPFADSDKFYTVAGFLDTDAAVQIVRVIPIRQSIDRPDSIADVPTVSTLDLMSGDRVVWTDSLVVLDDGSQGLIYRARFRPLPEHTYRLDVEGDRGTTKVEVVVPAVSLTATPTNAVPFPSASNFPVSWPGVSNVIAVDVFYDAVPTVGAQTRASLWIPYEHLHRGQLVDDNWTFDMRLLEDRTILSKLTGTTGELALGCLVLRVTEPSAGWQPPPGGVFDRDVLIQPGVFSNVTDGLGWFGAVTRTSYAWPIINIDRNILGSLDYLATERTAESCLQLADDAT